MVPISCCITFIKILLFIISELIVPFLQFTSIVNFVDDQFQKQVKKSDKYINFQKKYIYTKQFLIETFVITGFLGNMQKSTSTEFCSLLSLI